MNEVIITNGPDFLKLTIVEVHGFPKILSPFGGYDIECGLEIKSRGFSATGQIWSTTAVLHQLYEKLKDSNAQLTGEFNFDNNYERDLEFKIKYDDLGHVAVEGSFVEQHHNGINQLEFEFLSDQTFMQQTLLQLSTIVAKYGGMKGILE
jgi:hypothetical protein